MVADRTIVRAQIHDRSSRMRAIGAAIAQLRANPYPPEAFRWCEVLRLRVGSYRVMYTVEGDHRPRTLKS